MTTRRSLLAAAAALALLAGGPAGAQDEMDVALISKGFQHQFWQAVKTGADKAGAELGVNVTFEGPDTEAQVDRQIDMLSAALARKPAAIGFAALDSQAATPLLRQAEAEGIPVIAFDSGVDSDIPVATASTDNVAAAGSRGRQDGRADRRDRPSRRGRPRPDQPHRHRPRRGLHEPHGRGASGHRDRHRPVRRRRPAPVHRAHPARS